MLITEFGDAFKKIHHLHAHSHRLVPKQKIPFSFKYRITFSITWNFEILDTVLNVINKSKPEIKRNTRLSLLLTAHKIELSKLFIFKLLIHFGLVIQPKKRLSFASLKAVKCLFSFITQFIHQSMFWFILATVQSHLSHRIVNWYYRWFTSDSFLNLLKQCTVLCVFQLFFLKLWRWKMDSIWTDSFWKIASIAIIGSILIMK